jgi:hypothetical protein
MLKFEKLIRLLPKECKSKIDYDWDRYILEMEYNNKKTTVKFKELPDSVIPKFVERIMYDFNK